MTHRRAVALAVTGSIAAYKAPMVARLLLRTGLRVIPIMTRGAREFLGAATLSGLTGEPVLTEMFDPESGGERHVAIAKEVDVVAVVPATADFIARLASGRADDLASALCLVSRRPILVAPAMHPEMWGHPATMRNVESLRRDGRVQFVGPVEGEVASGEQGVGRLAEPEAIAEAIAEAILAAIREKQDLAGHTIVVSAGPTVEDLDPVRFLSNRSTGKMGFALAERARRRGARVILVAGPTQLETPRGVERVDVRGALSMQAALEEAMGKDLRAADALVMTAAVGDYRAREISPAKLKRSSETFTLDLIPNPDLIGEIGQTRSALGSGGDRAALPVLVAFAVETGSDQALIESAEKKLKSKQVDLVVANQAGDSFGKDDNRAILVDASGAEPLGTLTKRDLADRILDRIAVRWGTSR